MMDFLQGSKDYPLDAEWFELNPRNTIDETNSWEGSISFKYKDVTRRRSVEQAVQGIRKNNKTVIIESRSKLPFKEQDIVKTELGEYKIVQVEYIQDDNYVAKQILKNLNYHKVIITLE